jgi:tryptophan synthase alpha chain
MSRISERFAELRARGEKALVAYIAAGDPALAATPVFIRALEAGGADMVELGLAFSDPLADGPTIQAGSQRALAAGATTDKVFAMVAQLRTEGLKTPLLIMTYYNLLLRPGVANFCARAGKAGVDGLIIPDVPMEEADELLEAATAAGLELIQFVAPTSTADRIEKLARLASGFVYAVSLTGVTGERAALPARFQELVTAAKRHTETPVCVGFGISRPEQVREVAAVADGVIVGSAFVRICGETQNTQEAAERLRSLAADLKSATKKA